MEVMIICIYMLILIIIGLVVFGVLQIKLAGIKVKDVMRFSGPRLIIYSPIQFLKHIFE